MVLSGAISLALQGRVVRCARFGFIPVTIGHLLHLDGCTLRSTSQQTVLDLVNIGHTLITVHVRHHLAQVDGLLTEDDALLTFILL